MDKCPICNSPLEGDIICDSDKQIYTYFCYRCGTFNIEKKALNKYKKKSKNASRIFKKQIAIFTGWIRENQNVIITENTIMDFDSLKRPLLNERATNLLKSFTDPYDLIGGRKVINFVNLERIINIIEINEYEEHNVKFYEKCNFKVKSICMAKYFEKE